MGLGIDYNDTPSPYYSTDKNQYGEGNLLPLVSVRGIDPFDETNGLFAKDKGLTAIQGGTNRFIINISPLKNETYPHSGWDKTLINLDTIQLYAPNPKIDYKFGKDYEAATPDLDYPPYFSDTTGGVYDSPIPIRGAPIEFRKVYFRGQLVDEDGGYVTGSGCDERSFQAVFACSKPIEQTIHASGEYSPIESGLLLNPRNENFAQSEYAIEREWEEIEILSCGSGSGGCSTLSVDMYTTGNSGDYLISGDKMAGDPCNQFLVFSGDCVNQSYISGSGGAFSGYAGSLIEISGGKTLVDKYDPDEYETSYSPSEECNTCEKLIVFSGSGAGITIDTIRATGGDNSGACGSLITIGMGFETSGCLSVETDTSTNTVTYGIDRSGILECLGYRETGVRLITHSGGIYPNPNPTGFNELIFCDFFMLARCPTEAEVSGAPSGFITGCCIDPVGACCDEDGTCEVKAQTECNGYYWGDGTECDDPGSDFSDAFPAGRTLSQLCWTGVCCFFDITAGPVVAGNPIGEYVCEFNTYRYYYDTIFTNNKYEWDQDDPRYSNFPKRSTNAIPSEFHNTAGDDCTDCPPDPTTTTTTTTTTTSTPPPTTCGETLAVADPFNYYPGCAQTYYNSSVATCNPADCTWVGNDDDSWTIEYNSSSEVWTITDQSTFIYSEMADPPGCPEDADWSNEEITVTDDS